MKINNKPYFKHEVWVDFMPSTPLLGLNTWKGEVECPDGEWRQMVRFEIGVILFKFSYTNVADNQ